MFLPMKSSGARWARGQKDELVGLDVLGRAVSRRDRAVNDIYRTGHASVRA